MKELWDDLGYVGLGLSSRNLRDLSAKADRNLQSTSSDGVFASIEAPMHSEPENGLETLLNRNADECSELDLHISFEQAGVLHMKDQEHVVQRPQRQAPIHWENTRGLITAETSEQLNQPATSSNNNDVRYQKSYPNKTSFSILP